VCQDIEAKQKEIEKCLQAEKRLRESMSLECEKLKNDNSCLTDEVVDLQSRSMRDNLLFFGVSELNTIDERRNENCHERIMTLFKDNLLIENPENIKIDRIHRIGKFIAGKTRPIVAKFNYYQDKLMVKNAAFEKLKYTDYRISDQFPRAIQEKRRQLIPELITAREEGNDAVIIYDKLVVKGRKRPENLTRKRETTAMDITHATDGTTSLG
jgi:hypothetical protein